MEEIICRCGKDATLGAIQWRRSCAKRMKVEVGCGVEVPGMMGATPHWKIGQVGPGGRDSV